MCYSIVQLERMLAASNAKKRILIRRKFVRPAKLRIGKTERRAVEKINVWVPVRDCRSAYSEMMPSMRAASS